MLLANIIYLPGSGGSFLRRALTLSDSAIMHDPLNKITAQDKFTHYNNWAHHRWKTAEKMHRPYYRTGEQEFWRFEQSDMYLIDAWHPSEFITHDDEGTAWQTGAWPWLVIIKTEIYHRFFLERNQSSKLYMLDWQTETTNLETVIARYSDRSIYFAFEDLLCRSCFLNQIEKIDRIMNLNLVMDLVDRLWAEWYQASMTIWQQ